MRQPLRALAASILALLLSAQPGLAWGEVGHRVVGRIAAALLTAKAQKKVAQVLDVDNTQAAVADALSDAAEWPDAVAREQYARSISWHFIDLGVKPNTTKDDAQWNSPDTAYAKIILYFGDIKDGKPDELEPGSDLKFLAHLIGDVHQPLHTATDDDRGGNCLYIKFAKEAGGTSPRTKLHSAWDTVMLEDRLGTDHRLIARHLVRDWKNMTAAEKAALSNPQLSSDVPATVKTWIGESRSLATTKIYGSLQPAVPAFETAEVDSDCKNAAPDFKGKTWSLDETAAEQSATLMEHQLLKAGVRLAALLNAAAE